MVPLSSELSAEYARHGIKLPKEPETGVLIVDVLLSLHIHHRIYISHSPLLLIAGHSGRTCSPGGDTTGRRHHQSK